MNKSLPINHLIQKKYLYLIFVFGFLAFQRCAATTYYINDNDLKGDIYTTVVGNDANNGISSSTPKLSIKAVYEKAQDGDTIIIDTGSYTDLSPEGKLLFTVTKKITFVIAGVSEPVFSKIPLTKKDNAAPEEFYIDKDKPIDRKAYMHKLQHGQIKKSQ